MQQTDRKITKAEQCYIAIRDAIVSLEIQPGTRLTGEEWRQKLDVSPVPVREAFLKLMEDRLVVNTPYAGVRVTEIDLSVVPEILGIMESVTVLGAQLACQRFADEDFERLADVVRRMDENLDNFPEWYRLNSVFHREIPIRAGLELSYEMNERLQLRWLRIFNKYCGDIARKTYKQVHPDHEKIVDAMRERDVEMTTVLTRKHIRRTVEFNYERFAELGLIDQIRSFPGSLLYPESNTLPQGYGIM